MQVSLSAAKKLSEWEAIFAGQTIQKAKELAVESGASRISISHFRQAALDAIEGLKGIIELEEN